MIKSITFERFVKEFRSEIVKQSGLRPESVLNALSIRGTDIAKLISETKAASIDAADGFILFEFKEKPQGDNYKTEEADGTLSKITSFEIMLRIYGNGSYDLSQRLFARLKDSSVASSLRSKGIWINGIDTPESANEFVNNTLWIRHDLSVSAVVRFSFEKVSDEGYFYVKDESCDPEIPDEIGGIDTIIA